MRRAACQSAVRGTRESADARGIELGGTIELENREKDRRAAGLDATVRLPLAENAH